LGQFNKDEHVMNVHELERFLKKHVQIVIEKKEK
jgi:hypothetical protein